MIFQIYWKIYLMYENISKRYSCPFLHWYCAILHCYLRIFFSVHRCLQRWTTVDDVWRLWSRIRKSESGLWREYENNIWKNKPLVDNTKAKKKKKNVWIFEDTIENNDQCLTCPIILAIFPLSSVAMVMCSSGSSGRGLWPSSSCSMIWLASRKNVRACL